MFKLSDFNQDNYITGLPFFIDKLKSKWDEIHSDPNVFRYKINDLQERVVDEKYLLMVRQILKFITYPVLTNK